jgi:hypothetical protein
MKSACRDASPSEMRDVAQRGPAESQVCACARARCWLRWQVGHRSSAVRKKGPLHWIWTHGTASAIAPPQTAQHAQTLASCLSNKVARLGQPLRWPPWPSIGLSKIACVSRLQCSAAACLVRGTWKCWCCFCFSRSGASSHQIARGGSCADVTPPASSQ